MTWPVPEYFYRNIFYAITMEIHRNGMLSIVFNYNYP